MTRFRDWEFRLDELCRQRMRAPFVWGRHDCALFVADCVLAVSGLDLAGDCRGLYASKEEALALLASLGAADLEDYMASQAARFDLPEVGVRFAQRGDVVLYRQETGPSLGIVSLDGMRALIAVESGQADGKPRLLRVPVLECARAWRV